MSREQLDKLVRILAKQPPLGSGTIAGARRFLDAGGARFETPSDVILEPFAIGAMAAEWIAAPLADATAVVLYLHGGGYCIGSIQSHRYLMQNLSRAARARVLGIEYRLAPEHAFPAALEDAVRAYHWLLAQDHDARRIVIAGDSAGGGLTLATLLALRDAGDPLPAAAVCISPWTDLTLSSPSVTERAARDPMVRADDLRQFAAHYLAATDGRSPLASPLFADLRGLPPLLVHVGGREILYDDAVRLAANARAAGVDVTLIDEPELFHVWHAYAPMLDEGQKAVDEIGAYIRARLS